MATRRRTWLYAKASDRRTSLYSYPRQKRFASRLINGHFKSVIARAEIRQLPLPEKLALLEAVWTELASDPDTVEVPQWHKDILDERRSLLNQGSAQLIDWELAKDQINRLVR